jgi:DNA-binding transcriptional MerR regulator
MEKLPVILPDASGYRYGGERVDGFNDRLDLSLEARQAIAKMAQAVVPEALTDEQIELLELDLGDDRLRKWLSILTMDQALLTEADERGEFRELTDENYRWWRYPSEHPRLPDNARYPLTIGHAAALCGVGAVALRRWTDDGLVPALRGGKRYLYPAAGTLQAMLLAQHERYEIASLLQITRGGEGAALWVKTLGRTIDVMAQQAEAQGQPAGHVEKLRSLAEKVDEGSSLFAEIGTHTWGQGRCAASIDRETLTRISKLSGGDIEIVAESAKAAPTRVRTVGGKVAAE